MVGEGVPSLHSPIPIHTSRACARPPPFVLACLLPRCHPAALPPSAVAVVMATTCACVVSGWLQGWGVELTRLSLSFACMCVIGGCHLEGGGELTGSGQQ
jgi:hypothetical protein